MNNQKLDTPITIAIDGNEANRAQRVGSNVYAFEIISQLEKQTRDNSAIYWVVLLAEPIQTNLPKEREGWRYKVIGPKPFWTQWALPLHLFSHRHEYNILYTPGHYAPRFSPIAYVSSVMDLAFIEYPNYFKREDTIKLQSWTKYSVQHAAKVIAISEYTKKEIIKHYKRKPSDVVVAYPAGTDIVPVKSARAVESVLKKYDIRGPYILFVGTIQPRKNIEKLVAAFELILKRRMLPYKPQLVFAGKVGWLAEPIQERIRSSSVAKYIVTTGFISEREKAALYRNADAAVLLGLYEGFGIPPLEAMHYGTIPLVSNTTSLPEVVGKAGVTVDPTSTKEIAKAMVSLLTMKATARAKFRKEAREQIKKFSWDSSAKVVLDTLLLVADKKK